MKLFHLDANEFFEMFTLVAPLEVWYFPVCSVFGADAWWCCS